MADLMRENNTFQNSENNLDPIRNPRSNNIMNFFKGTVHSMESPQDRDYLHPDSHGGQHEERKLAPPQQQQDD